MNFVKKADTLTKRAMEDEQDELAHAREMVEELDLNTSPEDFEKYQTSLKEVEEFANDSGFDFLFDDEWHGSDLGFIGEGPEAKVRAEALIQRFPQLNLYENRGLYGVYDTPPWNI